MKGKDSEGNLSLGLMPLIALMAVGRFLVLSFFTCGQVKGGLHQVVSLRDVNVHAAGGRLSRSGSWDGPSSVAWLPPAAPSS